MRAPPRGWSAPHPAEGRLINTRAPRRHLLLETIAPLAQIWQWQADRPSVGGATAAGRALMFNLFDILQAQGGPDMQALGRQFGLTPSQSRSAMEALLPALTIGLQKNLATDPASFGRLFGLVDPEPKSAQPDLLMGQLFGSPAISQAVLQQAAAASGIGTQALRQILPVMAGMVVAGIVHVMLNQTAAPAPARPAPRTKADPDFSGMTLWNDWLESFQAAPSDKPASAKPPSERRPKAEDVQEAEIIASAPTKPPSPGKAESADPSLDAFQQMFETGVQVQEQNVKAMQGIFDSFWSTPPDQPPPTAKAAPAKLARRRAKPRGARKPAKI